MGSRDSARATLKSALTLVCARYFVLFDAPFALYSTSGPGTYDSAGNNRVVDNSGRDGANSDSRGLEHRTARVLVVEIEVRE